MNTLIALMIIAMPRVDLPSAEVLARFDAACTDGKWSDECPALRDRLEEDLFGDLTTLAANRAPIDREVLTEAIRADFPPLAEIGLRQLNRIASPDEHEAVRAALDHPSPAVRTAARRLLESEDQRWGQTFGRWWRPSSRYGWDAFVPDVVPEPARFGLQGADKLRYCYFASGDGRAVYTSDLSPEELMKVVAPGVKAKSGTQVAKAAEAQKERAENRKAAQDTVEGGLASTGLGALVDLTHRVSKGADKKDGGDKLPWTPVTEFSTNPDKVLYARLNAAEPSPAVQVAAGRDEALGKTLLVVTFAAP